MKLKILGKKFKIRHSHIKSYYYCVYTCSCGSSFISRYMRTAVNISCGCARYKIPETHKYTYNSWNSMIQRCVHNKRYTNKNISVCNEWEDFNVFLSEMGLRPNNKSIDRINNSLGYFKDNCRWSTAEEQANNTTANIHLTIDGVTKTAKSWSKTEGAVSYQTIIRRTKSGPMSHVDVVYMKMSPKNEKRMITIRGETKCISDWSKVKGSYTRSTITKKLKLGLSGEESVFGGKVI